MRKASACKKYFESPHILDGIDAEGQQSSSEKSFLLHRPDEEGNSFDNLFLDVRVLARVRGLITEHVEDRIVGELQRSTRDHRQSERGEVDESDFPRGVRLSLSFTVLAVENGGKGLHATSQRALGNNFTSHTFTCGIFCAGKRIEWPARSLAP